MKWHFSTDQGVRITRSSATA